MAIRHGEWKLQQWSKFCLRHVWNLASLPDLTAPIGRERSKTSDRDFLRRTSLWCCFQEFSKTTYSFFRIKEREDIEASKIRLVHYLWSDNRQTWTKPTKNKVSAYKTIDFVFSPKNKTAIHFNMVYKFLASFLQDSS